MKPIEFKQKNFTYKGNGYEDLPCFKDDQETITCWKMTWPDRIKGLIYGKVWLHVWGGNHPPVFLHTGTPFKEEECGIEEGPVFKGGVNRGKPGPRPKRPEAMRPK